MKGTILALASVLIAVAGMALVAPVAEVIAAEEATACPGTACIIGPQSTGSMQADSVWLCGGVAACDDCCNACESYDIIVGSPYCWCTQAGRRIPC